MRKLTLFWSYMTFKSVQSEISPQDKFGLQDFRGSQKSPLFGSKIVKMPKKVNTKYPTPNSHLVHHILRLFYYILFILCKCSKIYHTLRLRKFFGRISRNRDQNTIFMALLLFDILCWTFRSNFVVLLLLLTARSRRTRNVQKSRTRKVKET